jgi:DNA-binding CsgD family transcriptional regulator
MAGIDERWDLLSPAETRVIDLVAEGLSNPQIAERLYLSRRTVQSHMYNIFKKLRVISRSQLAAKVVERRHAPSGGSAVEPGGLEGIEPEGQIYEP